MSKIIPLILRFFGYVPQPTVEAVQLAYWIRCEAASEKPDTEGIATAAESLEKLLRSARK